MREATLRRSQQQQVFHMPIPGPSWHMPQVEGAGTIKPDAVPVPFVIPASVESSLPRLPAVQEGTVHRAEPVPSWAPPEGPSSNVQFQLPDDLVVDWPFNQPERGEAFDFLADWSNTSVGQSGDVAGGVSAFGNGHVEEYTGIIHENLALE